MITQFHQVPSDGLMQKNAAYKLDVSTFIVYTLSSSLHLLEHIPITVHLLKVNASLVLVPGLGFIARKKMTNLKAY